MVVVGAAGLGSAYLNTERTVSWVGEDGLEPEMPGNAGGFSIEVTMGSVRQVSKEKGKLI